MMAMCMLTACGGDDKDEDLPDGYQKTTEGVHRIEVSVDGDLTGWKPGSPLWLSAVTVLAAM